MTLTSLPADLEDLVIPPTLPCPRGPLSERLVAALSAPLGEMDRLPEAVDDPLDGDDSALALYICYELHYRGFEGVDPDWEWEPSLLRERRQLERAFERRLVEEIGPVPPAPEPAELSAAISALASTSTGPSLSAYMAARGSLDELREFAVHRSLYQLKEADPHTWAIPRLSGRSKAALVEIQYGEYGEGQADGMHAILFARTMRGLGLDSRYGAYADRVPGVTMATCNLVSLFGLHRKWRGALAGHLALFEMCSVGPMGRYEAALLRLGGSEETARFYREHVIADERHQVIALEELVGGHADADQDQSGHVVFGARALTCLEARLSAYLLDHWSAGQTSLLGGPLDFWTSNTVGRPGIPLGHQLTSDTASP